MQSIEIRVEGQVRLHQRGELQPEPETVSIEEFAALLRAAGIPHYEAGLGLSLGAQLERVVRHSKESRRPLLLLSRLDPQGLIDWQSLTRNRFPEDGVQRLIALLERWFRVIHFPDAKRMSRDDVSPANYGAYQPEVLAASVLSDDSQFNRFEPLLEQGILFIGPATLWALCDYLLYGRACSGRIVPFARWSLGPDPLSENLCRLIYIPNGVLHTLLAEHFAAGLGIAVEQEWVLGDDLLRGPYEPWDLSEAIDYNLFRHASFLFRPESELEARKLQPLPCNGCLHCNSVCPTGAVPLALLKGRVDRFYLSACIECGLCSFVCESRIDFCSIISNMKGGSSEA